MDVSIGIRNVAREISLDLEQDADAVKAAVVEALETSQPLTLTDSRGRTVIVPTDALGYVITSPEETRRVGFVH